VFKSFRDDEMSDLQELLIQIQQSGISVTA